MSHELAFTGSLFSVSGLVAYQYNNHTTAYLSFLLSLTSIWYHLYQSRVSFIADQIALYSVVVRSFIDGYNGGVPGILISCSINAYNYVLYFSPYHTYCCHSPDISIGKRWHMTIHCIAVLGIILQQMCIARAHSNLYERIERCREPF